ncbi:MAG: hypothetical protein WD988_04085 [Candidatus Curtissbacteria bacterium]
MKKIIIFSLAGLILAAIAFFAWATYISFKVVKPTTVSINTKLQNHLSSVVKVPEGIPYPSNGFDEVSYTWEMETLSNEVSAINYKYTPAYQKSQKAIEVSLYMPENGDPSIFTKVLPAIIFDEQSVKATEDPLKANTNGNSDAGYSQIILSTSPKTGKTTSISWIFKKEDLPKELKEDYAKLNQYPDTLVSILYKIPSFLVSLVAG